MKSDEIDREIASAVAGSLIWLRLREAGLVPPDSGEFIDREKTRDLLARCEEHGVLPDYLDVLAFIVALARDAYPEDQYLEDYADAQRFVLQLMAELREYAP